MQIMSEEEHKHVKNLNKETVKKLDILAQNLLLDTNYWLYSARTRLNDQTGHTVNCIYYGQNINKHND